MKNLCIIPARGGSKRIPKKNIRDFLGKPIIAHSIETALNSGLFDEVMVSTDSQEIAEVAESFGAKVPFIRSSQNSDDHATLSEVVDEVIEQYKDGFELGCCLLPTAPLVTDHHLSLGLKMMNSGSFLSVRPVVRFDYPIQRALKMDQSGEVQWTNSSHVTTRSQDLEPMYHDAGQFYWFRMSTGMVQEKRGAFEISRTLVQDIDSEEDWSMAELKYKLKANA